MIRDVVIALALVACGKPEPATPHAKKVGGHNAVCALGSRHDQDKTNVEVFECGPDLSCCYPCGTDGCDDICMTPAECSQKRP